MADPAILDAYIYRLPLELLGDIAFVASELDPHSIWTFVTVCRYWRVAALSTPACWSRIHIKDTERDRAHLMDPKMTLWLSRARHSELEICLHGRTSAMLFAEPLERVSVSRISTLHLGTWDPSFALRQSLGPLHFTALRTLSVGEPNGPHSKTKLSTIVTTFIAAETDAKGTWSMYAPLLEHLAVSHVFIDIKSFPRLATLRSLKLSQCEFGQSTPCLSFISQAKQYLQTVSLVGISQKYTPYSSRSQTETLIEEVEFPKLTSLTLIDLATATLKPKEIVSNMRCPSLNRLTCNDDLLSAVHPGLFPRLSNLFVQTTSCGRNSRYERVLSEFELSYLTIYRDNRSQIIGLNGLFWTLAHSPKVVQHMKQVRMVASGGRLTSRTMVDRLNESRSSRDQVRQGRLFFREVLANERDGGDMMPWGEYWASALDTTLADSVKIPNYGGRRRSYSPPDLRSGVHGRRIGCTLA